jgi:hypothetical protein
LASLAADGHSVCADVLRRPGHDGEESGIAPQAAERQRRREGAADGRETQRSPVRRRVCRGGSQLATTVLFLAMPLVLASPLSLLIMLLYIPLIAKRIKNEEMVLEEGLEGYRDYKRKVKYKVIPFIW